jgi:hypothetical protein
MAGLINRGGVVVCMKHWDGSQHAQERIGGGKEIEGGEKQESDRRMKKPPGLIHPAAIPSRIATLKVGKRNRPKIGETD